MTRYLADMRAIAVKLALLVALLLMPFGMTAAPAAPVHPSAHAGRAMGHCPEEQPATEKKAGIAECTMACAAALPAIELGSEGAPTIASVPQPNLAAQRLHGLQPETATPPPKRS